MAIVNASLLSALFTNYSVVFNDAFLAASSANIPYERWSLVVPSDTDTEQYNWLGTVPAMKEWVDERQVESLAAYNYSLRNKHYEATIEVDRDEYEDDKFGLIAPRIRQLALEAVRYENVFTISNIVSGGSSAGYDGVNFFATTHTEESSGTQSNNLTGTGVTLAAVRADFIAARAAMRKFKDGKGRVMNIAPDLVIAPPELQDIFEQLLNTNLVTVGSVAQDNNLKGAADLIIDANLTDATDWFLLSTNGPMKPFIFQRRQAPQFVAHDNPQSDIVFMQKKFHYGVDSRFAAGYGLWQLAIRTVNS